MSQQDELGSLIYEFVKRHQGEASIYGKQPPERISALEKSLDTMLPQSYRDFLRNFGGLSYLEGGIYGVDREKVEDEKFGLVYFETERAKELGLPEGLIVISSDQDEAFWAIDIPKSDEGEAPVVLWELGGNCSEVSKSFSSFLKGYLQTRLS